MSSSGIPLEEMTLRQLRKVASEYRISRYSRMRKEQLVATIKAIQPTQVSDSPAKPAKTATPAAIEASKPDKLSNLNEISGPTEASEFTKISKSPQASQPKLKVDTTNSQTLADVDSELVDLPNGYGENRIVLLPRNPQWAYTYWDIPNENREALRQRGGIRLALRFYDVTNINLIYQQPRSIQQYECDEMDREWYVPVPVSDRDYAIEIGYLTNNGHWLMLARSATIHVPPVYPSDWVDDQFVNVNWNDNLNGKTIHELTTPPHSIGAFANNISYDQTSRVDASTVAMGVPGSLFNVTPSEQNISSHTLPSGMGMWSTSGMGMTLSGAGLGASFPLIQPRKFWLVANAELVVYGATEPDATVTIGDRIIKLNPDGTFHFQISLQDGLLNYPIQAVAADGEQTRSIQMQFTRETSEDHTNTKTEAVEEWFS